MTLPRPCEHFWKRGPLTRAECDRLKGVPINVVMPLAIWEDVKVLWSDAGFGYIVIGSGGRMGDPGAVVAYVERP